MSLTWEDLEEIAEELAAVFDPAEAARHRARWNVAPSDPHPVVGLGGGGVRRLTFARWGFGVGAPAGTPIMINARAETAPLKDSYRQAFARGRCLVPADGFYEWATGERGGAPCWIHRRDGRLLLMAGLCEGRRDGGDDQRRFTILTTTANATLAHLHHRMPVILAPEHAGRWLREGGTALLRPAPEDWLVLRPVSRRVNSVRHDDPACLAAEAPAPPRQLRLL
jgi:putative SOS response-associated peptidase YedK